MLDPKQHAKFRISTIEELLAEAEELGLEIPISEDTSVLAKPVELLGRALPNAMAIQPMEGCDGLPNGAPDALTFRRYERFGAGGAGLLWFEACAVTPEGRANPRQLWINEEVKADFASLVQRSRKAATDSMGSGHRPLLVLQLTHSGRYSRPEADPKPVIAFHDPILDKDRGLPEDYPLVSDDYLDGLVEKYVSAAKLAFEAGFDAVDVKACHRYLMNELLAAHTREGKYGGSYENRTRLLKTIIAEIRRALGNDAMIACRIGVYDCHPYPYGWGVNKDNHLIPDSSEPLQLAKELADMGVSLLNVTMGNPYFNPHVNRPYDTPIEGAHLPNEHPLLGVARLISLTRAVQQAVPQVVVVGSGFSWLRNLWPYAAAGNILAGGMRVAGLGRQAFAFPAFAKEIIETGKLDRRHTCITCSSCTQIMRDGGRAGCVPFDKEIYAPIYREGRRASRDFAIAQAKKCRDCFDPTCRDGCPAGVDIPGFIRALADGDVKKSYEILRSRNLLPELCAYICPSEVQCEAHCIEKVFTGNPLPIRELQKFVSVEARKRGWTSAQQTAEPTGKRIAVIGAGPAGLACAASLLQKGHSVDIFDLHSTCGGTAKTAIPEKRLSTGVAESEIQSLLKTNNGHRLEVHCGEGLTESRNLDHYARNYDAVFLAIGLGGTVGLPGEKPLQVEDAVSFLKRAKSEGAEVPPKVAVLGGGNTAMDAATTAVACGAEDVYIIYRRSFAEMPAWPTERDEALALGVHFLILTQPLGYVADEKGRLTGIRIARTELGAPGPDGRRSPVVIPNTESVLKIDMALEALGQAIPEGVERLMPGVELNEKRLIKVDAKGRTSRPGVWAGGDVANGGATAVQAIAEGMRAAEDIDFSLTGELLQQNG